jgi:hypothetical protein
MAISSSTQYSSIIKYSIPPVSVEDRAAEDIEKIQQPFEESFVPDDSSIESDDHSVVDQPDRAANNSNRKRKTGSDYTSQQKESFVPYLDPLASWVSRVRVDYGLGEPSRSVYEVWDGLDKKEPILRRTSITIPKKARNTMFDKAYRYMREIDEFCCSAFRMPPLHNWNQLMKVYVVKEYKYKSNAFWDPAQRKVTVEKGRVLDLLCNADPIAHEFGHALIDHTAQFNYREQGGALHESIADTIAIMAKHQKEQKLPIESSWLFAEGVDYETRTKALRSFERPKDDPRLMKDATQAKTMGDYRALPGTEQPEKKNDYGSVHYNAGIPSHAFYLAAQHIQRYTWQELGKIWIHALYNGDPQDDFEIFALRTLEAVGKLRYNDEIRTAVSNAWRAVGVNYENSFTKLLVVKFIDDVGPFKTDFYNWLSELEKSLD